MSNITLSSHARFLQQIDALFNSIHDDFWRSPAFAYSRNWRPTEVAATDKEYKIEIELPRVKREEVDVKVLDGSLAVTVNAKTYEYSRAFSYSDAKPEEAKVTLADGVLTISIPRVGPKIKQLTVQ